jgi:ribosomal protein S8
VVDMKKKIEDIIESKSFGEDLQILSDFIEAPAMFLNYYMRRDNITDYSIFDVEYEPKFKTTPCDKTTFDFKININNNYNMEMSIHKIDRVDEEELDTYKFQFKFMDEIETFESDTIKNVHFFIGDHIAKILDRKLKNK